MTVTPWSKSTFESIGAAKCKAGYETRGSNEVECSSSAKWEFTDKDSICFKGIPSFIFNNAVLTPKINL